MHSVSNKKIMSNTKTTLEQNWHNEKYHVLYNEIMSNDQVWAKFTQ